MFKYTKIRDVKSPTRGTSQSAGIDLYVPNDYPETTLKPGESVNIPSGIKMIIPENQAGIFFNKSGVGVKGILVGACVVDSDYRGEVHLNVHNCSLNDYKITPGLKLTQIVLTPVNILNIVQITPSQFDTEGSTERGSGGFGSTGVS